MRFCRDLASHTGQETGSSYLPQATNRSDLEMFRYILGTKSQAPSSKTSEPERGFVEAE